MWNVAGRSHFWHFIEAKTGAAKERVGRRSAAGGSAAASGRGDGLLRQNLLDLQSPVGILTTQRKSRACIPLRLLDLPDHRTHGGFALSACGASAILTAGLPIASLLCSNLRRHHRSVGPGAKPLIHERAMHYPKFETFSAL